ncbi:hypothetical protein AB4Y40_41705 [Paraburkholderia sp. EG287B]|uniref:hypothetical protein n=1 Tax=Paraburkholderia sp. EG287B TaxID=3237010 RepID=UPI0034D1B0BB
MPAALSTNRPIEFDVKIALEQPEHWSVAATEALQILLGFQGDAVWHWTISGGAEAHTAVRDGGLRKDDASIDCVTLFSGGLDSTCGIARAHELASRTRLVSHYSRQKTRQLEISRILGYQPPTQIRISGVRGRGRGFLYRSFYFLCLSAAVASTYETRRIIQYENGILALAVPPSPAYFMTRHAHPVVQRAAERLFGAVLGGDWSIENPFLERTKGECTRDIVAILGDEKATKIIAQTETCWYQYSNQLSANRSKRNGIPCGVCVPCIVRRTAVQRLEGHYDLNDQAVRQDPVLARDFDAYRKFIDRTKLRGGATRMFLEFPGYVRDLTQGENAEITRDRLIDLFHRFAIEFDHAFPSINS